MIPDPFAGTACSQFVGPFEALLRGIPDGACLSINFSPLGAFVAIAGIGLVIAALQALVKTAMFGRKDRYRSLVEDQPEMGLREAANRARANRQAGEFR